MDHGVVFFLLRRAEFLRDSLTMWGLRALGNSGVDVGCAVAISCVLNDPEDSGLTEAGSLHGNEEYNILTAIAAMDPLPLLSRSTLSTSLLPRPSTPAIRRISPYTTRGIGVKGLDMVQCFPAPPLPPRWICSPLPPTPAPGWRRG
eukprot:scaffold136168_cov32-Tisochrysis_lutea.AAC.3